MANYIDADYDKKSDPKFILVWEQNYETNEIEIKKYPIEDYIYFFVESDKETDLKSMTGKYVNKFFAPDFKSYNSGTSAQNFRDLGLEVYESDITPIQKCLFDNYGTDNQKSPVWNLALYDIEVNVNMDEGFPDPNEAKYEITAISVWYKNQNKFFNFTLVPEYLQNIWNYDESEEINGCTVVYFRHEKEMLETFFAVTAELETSALGAWNGDFFDIGYIYNRCVRLWDKKTTAKLMGNFNRIRVTKVERENSDEVFQVVRPIGRIWFDSLEVYKKQAGEKDSYNLNAVAEDELDSQKVDFAGNFEELYHGTRRDRKRFDEIVEELGIKKKDLGKFLKTSPTGSNVEELQKLIETFKETYRIFVEYSIQDTQILVDLETKTNYFNVMMMLAQYNVSFFQDVFATLKQAENGITNFAHNKRNLVVIDRKYDIKKQKYNEFVDPDILDILDSRKFKVNHDDSEEIVELKNLISKSKIPGAHVLLPQIGLISYDAEESSVLGARLKKVKKELAEINKQLEEFSEDE